MWISESGSRVEECDSPVLENEGLGVGMVRDEMPVAGVTPVRAERDSEVSKVIRKHSPRVNISDRLEYIKRSSTLCQDYTTMKERVHIQHRDDNESEEPGIGRI